MRTAYRTRIDYASDAEVEAIYLLIEHGEYTPADFEADAQELDNRRTDAMSFDWTEERELQEAA